jgi:hypothetical protein
LIDPRDPSNDVSAAAGLIVVPYRTRRLVDLSHGECDVERTLAGHAREHERRLRVRELRDETLNRRRRYAAGLGRVIDASLAVQRIRNRQLAAWRAREPLIGVQAGERSARSDVDESRRAGELRARVGEVELLRNTCAPALEKIRAE